MKATAAYEMESRFAAGPEPQNIVLCQKLAALICRRETLYGKKLKVKEG